MKKLIVIAVLLLMSSQGWATDYYVATTGNNSNDGSIGSPWLTIQKCANTISAGDTCNIRGGIYYEKVSITTSGSAGNYITYKSYGHVQGTRDSGEAVYLDGTGLGSGVMISNGSTHAGVSYLKIMGLKIRNFGETGSAIGEGITFHGLTSYVEIRDNEIYDSNQATGAYGHAIQFRGEIWGGVPNPTYVNVSNIIIDNNYVHNHNTGTDLSHDEAITLAMGVQYFQITNNTIDDTNHIGIDVIGKSYASRPSQYGIISGNTVSNSGNKYNDTCIYIDGAKNITIENNLAYNCYGHGYFTGNEDSGGLVAENVIVRRNRAYNNFRNMSIGGAYTGTSANHRIVHNTVATLESGNYANFMLGKGTGHIAKNNIGYYYGSGTLDHMIESDYNIDTTGTTLNYNNYYPASYSGMKYEHGGHWLSYDSLSAYVAARSQDGNSISTDPLFRNVGAYDFTLQAGSPAINAGTCLTTTSSGDTGTVITVADARYFHDGYGITGVSGDTIRVGSSTVTVTDVDYSANTITVGASFTWGNGDCVSYIYYGSAPDMGYAEFLMSISGLGTGGVATALGTGGAISNLQ